MMATANPRAVATKASEIPAATTANPPVPATAILSKALIIPTTVPNSPMNGALLATVPRIQRCFLSFWVSSNIASVANVLAVSIPWLPSLSKTCRKIRAAGLWEFCLHMAIARSRCPFLMGSRRDSVMRRVTEPIFLSDQRRSSTTVR